MLCHIKNLQNPEPFLERLARAGCAGVLLEVHVNTDDPRQSILIQTLCKKLNLQYWLMPIIDNPPAKQQAWILDVSNGAPQPMQHKSTFDALNIKSADYLYDQLKKYIDVSPDGIFLPSPFADSHQPFPWTPDFEKYFSKQHGYEFHDKWHSLISTTGADDAKVRQHYWETINSLIDDFLNQCSQLANKAKSTFRHNLQEPELAVLSLSPQTISRRRAAHSIEIIHFDNWPQALKSTFECYLNDAMHVAITLPEYFDEEPSAQYFALSQNTRNALFQGENTARVGLLFPLRSARTHYHPDSHRYPRWVGEDLTQMVDYLHSMHYDYRLVDETELQNPLCELLVIPSITAISTESWNAIESWIHRGGKVACAGLLPRWSERGRDAELEERISRATKQTLQDVYDGYLAWEQGTALPPHIGYPIFHEDLSGGRLCSYTPRLNHDAEDARLRLSQIFRESLQSDFSSQNPDIIYRHFRDAETEQFAVYNNGDQTQEFICRCIPARNDAPRKISQLNLKTAKAEPICVWSIFPELDGGGISLSLMLAAQELCIYELNFRENQWHLWRSNFDVEKINAEEIHGYAQESVRPFCVQERNGKTIQWTAAKVLLPSPVWIDEEDWHQNEITFTTELFVPAEWSDHRVMLEMRLKNSAATLKVNEQDCGTLIAPPFLFYINDAIIFGEKNRIQLQLWQNEEIAPIPARLVAWPIIHLKIDQSKTV